MAAVIADRLRNDLAIAQSHAASEIKVRGCGCSQHSQVIQSRYERQVETFREELDRARADTAQAQLGMQQKVAELATENAGLREKVVDSAILFDDLRAHPCPHPKIADNDDCLYPGPVVTAAFAGPSSCCRAYVPHYSVLSPCLTATMIM